MPAVTCSLCGIPRPADVSPDDGWVARYTVATDILTTFCPACVERRLEASRQPPMTMEEAERAYAEAPAVELPQGYVDRMLAAVKRMIALDERRN